MKPLPRPLDRRPKVGEMLSPFDADDMFLVVFSEEVHRIDTIERGETCVVLGGPVPQHLGAEAFVKVLSPRGVVGYVLYKYSLVVA